MISASSAADVVHLLCIDCGTTRPNSLPRTDGRANRVAAFAVRFLDRSQTAYPFDLCAKQTNGGVA